MLLLLIQNDEAQIGTGREHGGAGAHNDPGFPGANPLPLVVPLSQSQAAVENGHGLAEPGGHQSQKLGSQGNFRHQKQGGFAVIQAFLNQLNVYRGFAGAGDAVEQGHTGLLQFHLSGEPIKAALLLWV